VLLIPQFIQITKLGLYNTYLGQALPPAANNAAMGILLMTAFFKGIPKSLFEAAEIEGANEWTIYSKIVLPLSKPILGTVAIMTGIRIWNNFIWPLVCTSGEKVRPVIIAITLLQGNINEGDGLKLAAYLIASLPLIILFFFMTKPFISGLTAGAVKG
jgi:ABC-type glycerol-3-phosphate transport system permease component